VLCVRWYLRYSVSYRDLTEIMRVQRATRAKTIHAIPTGMITRMAIRQMLAAACSHETQVLEEHWRRGRDCPESSARTRVKIFYVPRAQL
jgi:ribosomal protein L31E